MELFVAEVNSDQTEGRGPMRAIGYFLTFDAALERVKGEGVMGVGDGEVVLLTIDDNDSGDFIRDKVYGYIKTASGWRHTFAPGWGPQRNDPEMAEFLRLRDIMRERYGSDVTG